MNRSAHEAEKPLFPALLKLMAIILTARAGGNLARQPTGPAARGRRDRRGTAPGAYPTRAYFFRHILLLGAQRIIAAYPCPPPYRTGIADVSDRRGRRFLSSDYQEEPNGRNIDLHRPAGYAWIHHRSGIGAAARNRHSTATIKPVHRHGAIDHGDPDARAQHGGIRPDARACPRYCHLRCGSQAIWHTGAVWRGVQVERRLRPWTRISQHIHHAGNHGSIDHGHHRTGPARSAATLRASYTARHQRLSSVSSTSHGGVRSGAGIGRFLQQ